MCRCLCDISVYLFWPFVAVCDWYQLVLSLRACHGVLLLPHRRPYLVQLRALCYVPTYSACCVSRSGRGAHGRHSV